MRPIRDVSLAEKFGQLPCTEQESSPLIVVKLGGSVLRSVHDLPRAAGELYRLVRAGRRVIAVVSAFEGETDRLFELARQAGGTETNGIADLVSLGEEKSAAALRIACGRIGLDAMIVRPEELCIHTSGERLQADPEFIHLPALVRLSTAHEILIMPGFVGLDDQGRRTLLGRGGSDFSAIFIAGETGAALRLCKDVDGVFDHDPAAEPPNLKRYRRIGWQECLAVARPLLQPRAVAYACGKRLRIEVAALGSANPTIVDAETESPEPVVERPPLRIGLAGFGTVGQALQARLEEESGFEIAAILVRDLEKIRRTMPAVPLLDDRSAFFERGFDILVDATGGSEVGKALTMRQLAGAHHVVSANKAVIAANLRALRGLQAWGGRLRYSATVGGSAPMLELARRARSRGPVNEAVGVLNGTVNFLLDEMSRGLSFDEALAMARKAGFAESDPAADLSGADAAAKLGILAAEIWGEAGLDLPIEVQPLDEALCGIITASGERWLQVSRLTLKHGRPAGAICFVPAAEVPDFPPLPGEWNYLILRSDSGQALKASGRGAGGAPTAEAIVADLIDIAADRDSSG